MNERQFEKWLFCMCDGFFGDSTWRDPKLGMSYDEIVDSMAMNCSDEQWMIVEETMQLLADPDHIIGEVELDTPVSSNNLEEWRYE